MTLGTRLIIVLSVFNAALGADVAASSYAKWKSGPPHDADFFPIAVWLQNPSKADKYKQAGINTYVGLWRGPTEKQLAELRQSGMKVICHQN